MSAQSQDRSLNGAFDQLSRRLAGFDEVIATAHALADRLGAQAGDGGRNDAFREILVMAEIARRWGPRAARLFADGHHFLNGADDDGGENRALEAGLAIGRQAKSWEEVVDLARRETLGSPAASGETPDDGKAAARKAAAEMWKPGEADPLDRDVKNWSKKDLAMVMAHKDYSRPNAPSAKLRHDQARRYFELHRDDPDDNGELTKAIFEVNQPGHGKTAAPEGSLQRFRDELVKVDDPAEDIALKPVHSWTEDEAKQVMARRIRMPGHDPRAQELADKETAWFKNIYGEAPVKHDPFGKMIEPKPVMPIPGRSTPALDADGRPLHESLLQVGQDVAEAAGDKGEYLSNAIRGLQSGINLLNGLRDEFAADAAAEEERVYVPASMSRVAEDGEVGPQTRGALRRALAKFGLGKVKEGLALGRFRDYAKGGVSGDYGDLDKASDETLGRLYRDPEAKLGKTSPRMEVEALQETVNQLGSETYGPESWDPVQVDGWIGDETKAAFNLVAKSVHPDRFAKRLAENLGLQW